MTSKRQNVISKRERSTKTDIKQTHHDFKRDTKRPKNTQNHFTEKKRTKIDTKSHQRDTTQLQREHKTTNNDTKSQKITTKRQEMIEENKK